MTDKKLFQFVSKLIFDTNARELRWTFEGSRPYNTQVLGDYQTLLVELYSAPTPDGKKLQFSYTDVQSIKKTMLFIPLKGSMDDYKLELLNDDHVELSLNHKSVSSLEDLYKVIRKQMYDVSPSAEETIDLILNANREAAVH